MPNGLVGNLPLGFRDIHSVTAVAYNFRVTNSLTHSLHGANSLRS